MYKRQTLSFRTSAHYFRGNLHRISDYLSSSIRRGRVPRPPEFRELYGAGRETRPLRCFYGWSDKFPIFQTGALPQQACYIIGEFSGIVKQGKAGALSFILRFRQSGLIFRPGKAMLPLRSTVSVTSLYLIKGAYHSQSKMGVFIFHSLAVLRDQMDLGCGKEPVHILPVGEVTSIYITE